MPNSVHPLSNAEHAILGLLAEKPRHGYEIEQVIVERGMRDWTEIGFSSIYYVLGRLQRAGLATATTTRAPGRGPARRMHSPTQAGLEALRAATLAGLGTPAPVARPLLLALANLPLIEPNEAHSALGEHVTALAARLAAVRVQHAREEGAPLFVDALFDYSERALETEIAWLTGFAARLAGTHDMNTEMP